jgi:hypothetical protein
VKAALASMNDAAESLLAASAREQAVPPRGRAKPKRRPIVKRGQAATAKRER